MEDDERLLKKETVEEFFRPQLKEMPKAVFNGMLQSSDMVSDYNETDRD